MVFVMHHEIREQVLELKKNRANLVRFRVKGPTFVFPLSH